MSADRMGGGILISLSVTHLGRVAELADAQDSGSCVRKDVGVQVPPRPLSTSRSGDTRDARKLPTSTGARATTAEQGFRGVPD